jgi:hypothetical protein
MEKPDSHDRCGRRCALIEPSGRRPSAGVSVITRSENTNNAERERLLVFSDLVITTRAQRGPTARVAQIGRANPPRFLPFSHSPFFSSGRLSLERGPRR